jgi:hypothetical protein
MERSQNETQRSVETMQQLPAEGYAVLSLEDRMERGNGK